MGVAPRPCIWFQIIHTIKISAVLKLSVRVHVAWYGSLRRSSSSIYRCNKLMYDCTIYITATPMYTDPPAPSLVEDAKNSSRKRYSTDEEDGTDCKQLKLGSLKHDRDLHNDSTFIMDIWSFSEETSYFKLQGYLGERRGEREDMQDAHLILDDWTATFTQSLPNRMYVPYFPIRTISPAYHAVSRVTQLSYHVLLFHVVGELLTTGSMMAMLAQEHLCLLLNICTRI